MNISPPVTSISNHYLSPFLALKFLPLLSASSCLKKLDVSGCGIQFLPHDLFDHKLEKLNLSKNKGRH